MALNWLAMLRKRSTKTIIVILLGSLFIYTFFTLRTDYGQQTLHIDDDYYSLSIDNINARVAEIDRFYERRKNWSTSVLGTWLFKPYEETNYLIPQNRMFTILVWKYWRWLKMRHVFNYNSGYTSNPLKDCSVKNCIFTGENDMLETADAVVIHFQHGLIPNTTFRHPQQRWIFLNDESPKNAFSLSSKKLKLQDFANVFNWSMTYRSNADIPVPYGRTVVLNKAEFKYLRPKAISEIIPNWQKKRRDVIATILISNCNVKFRMNFLKELQKHIPVHVYGKCSSNETLARSCPGHFRSNCEPISEYLFYLALENTNCREYLTEKIWHNSYWNGAIPVIMGPSLSDCQNLLPPNSFLHIPITSSTEPIKQLAKALIRISKSEDEILSFHDWRYHFKVVNEHGYFHTPSRHLCRVCEAMNYNNVEEKHYSEEDLKQFLDPSLTCAK